VIGKLRGLEGREPRSVRHGRTPAQIANGGRCVGNAEEFADACGRDGATDGTVEGKGQRLILLGLSDLGKAQSAEVAKRTDRVEARRFLR